MFSFNNISMTDWEVNYLEQKQFDVKPNSIAIFIQFECKQKVAIIFPLVLKAKHKR